MAKNILLLRGINVGGHGKLPMADLRLILANLGATNVETYIQSGNVVFDGALQTKVISDAINASKGFRPRILMLAAGEFKTIASDNPWPNIEGKLLHIWFAADSFDFDHTKAETLRTRSETLKVTARAIYLHAPDGIGRSKLAEKMENLTGVECTARNLNTVNKLLKMV